MPKTIPHRILLAAGATLMLALPATAQAQADAGGKDYPPCSATVTDSCVQHEGGAHAKAAHHARRAPHHRIAHKHHD